MSFGVRVWRFKSQLLARLSCQSWGKWLIKPKLISIMLFLVGSMSWLMRLQGERAPRPQLAIMGPPMKMIFWHHFKGALVSLYFHITSVMSTNGLGQEVNKVRERLAHVDVPAELMRQPAPPLKASGNPLPAHRTPRFTQGRGFQQGGREKTKNICFSPWTHQIHDKTLVNESKKIYYSQEQGNRWSASSSYDYSKLLVTIQTWRGRWLNAVSCMALLSLRLI